MTLLWEAEEWVFPSRPGGGRGQEYGDSYDLKRSLVELIFYKIFFVSNICNLRLSEQIRQKCMTFTLLNILVS